jgi:hypothetical protein
MHPSPSSCLNAACGRDAAAAEPSLPSDAASFDDESSLLSSAPTCSSADAARACPQMAALKAEVARYANAVDRVRDLVRALRAASEGNGIEPAPELYWPHLLEVVERVLPEE